MPQKPTYIELEQRISKLEKELSKLSQLKNEPEKQTQGKTSFVKNELEIKLEDLFNIDDIQRIQDEFSLATGVASILTRPDGTPITTPSNFCRLCKDIIRKTKKGLANCFKSDAVIGRFDPNGPIIKPCMSGGLWDAGAGITVGGQHIANWLIGQVRDESQTQTSILKYAKSIGADETLVLEAFEEVPAMSLEKFEQIAKVLFTIANQLSTMAYQNIQQEHFIKEIKKTEAKLRESEKKYRQLFESSMDAILIMSFDQLMFIDCNPATLKLFGVDSTDVFRTLSPTDLSPTFQDDGTPSQEKIVIMCELAMKKGVYTFEWKHKKLISNEIFDANVLLSKVEIDGQTFLQGTVRDISHHKRTQELLIQSEKMLSVGGLAAGMAHEINNPLAGMMQSANVMKSRLENINIPANLKVAEELGITMDDLKSFMEKRGIFRMLDAIHHSGTRAAEIVSSMLSFARKSDAAISSHYPDQLMDKILELAATDYDLKKRYDFKSIKIIKRYADGLPLLPCDGAKIQQVLLNILRNGAQAMQTAKTEFPRFIIRIYKTKEPEMVCMEIEDNGPGMDEDTRSKVFDPFFTTKPVGIGTGLGLSVSYFIITENHKGKMDVISEPGNGATFIIRLPIKRN